MKSCVPKEEAPQKLVAKIQFDHRICKVKKISLPNRQTNVSNTFEEAKATIKARKRKERQESVSSQYQDRKVIRSNSEERPVSIKEYEDKSDGIRRVSSSGDFPKTTGDEKTKSSPTKNDHQFEKTTLAYDDKDHDKKRSHERFARPHTFKNRKYPNKRFKVRGQSKLKLKNDLQECTKRNSTGEHEQSSSVKFLDLHPPEAERSPSPVNTPVTPVLDLATLHEQVDSCEPLLSQPSNEVDENTETMPSQYIASTRMQSSPRNSIIATHRIYLDPDLAQGSTSMKKPLQNPVNERIQKLNKQINSCKKKILNCEAEFETTTGHRPSQLDKLNDEVMRKLYAELSKLKKEQKQLSEMSVGCFRSNLSGPVPNETTVSLRDTVKEIEQRLSSKRDVGNRNVCLEEMTAEQLIEEKIETQKALLFLESVHGRAQTKEDRDIVRPFYDRYRMLKRMMAKISVVGVNAELATIHENEAMHFVTPTSSSNETESEKTDLVDEPPHRNDSESCAVENLHSLAKPDLLKQMRIVTEEKKELRRKIKQFEISTQEKTCRMLTKEDKKPMEETYVAYKKLKGRSRLLEALLAKY